MTETETRDQKRDEMKDEGITDEARVLRALIGDLRGRAQVAELEGFQGNVSFWNDCIAAIEQLLPRASTTGDGEPTRAVAEMWREEAWRCYVESGADPDGDDARHLNPGEAPAAVRAMRQEYDAPWKCPACGASEGGVPASGDGEDAGPGVSLDPWRSDEEAQALIDAIRPPAPPQLDASARVDAEDVAAQVQEAADRLYLAAWNYRHAAEPEQYAAELDAAGEAYAPLRKHKPERRWDYYGHVPEETGEEGEGCSVCHYTGQLLSYRSGRFAALISCSACGTGEKIADTLYPCVSAPPETRDGGEGNG
jgi:hypothetical protein